MLLITDARKKKEISDIFENSQKYEGCSLNNENSLLKMKSVEIYLWNFIYIKYISL